jgi:hypothetical protein
MPVEHAAKSMQTRAFAYIQPNPALRQSPEDRREWIGEARRSPQLGRFVQSTPQESHAMRPPSIRLRLDCEDPRVLQTFNRWGQERRRGRRSTESSPLRSANVRIVHLRRRELLPHVTVPFHYVAASEYPGRACTAGPLPACSEQSIAREKPARADIVLRLLEGYDQNRGTWQAGMWPEHPVDAPVKH